MGEKVAARRPLSIQMTVRCFLLLGSVTWAWAQPSLTRAYTALQARDYERAVDAFEEALRQGADRAPVRKDLAYTLLKIGETEAARDHFSAALRLDPKDEHLGLEHAYLCYETRREAEARAGFDRLRQSTDPAIRAAAEQAFENVDRPLRDGIDRWRKVLAGDPANFSAHEELAGLAERRADLDLAAAHYDQAWRLRLARRDMLLGLGRVLLKQGRTPQALPVLLAVSRSDEPRVAEQARALLPRRYPYPYEFREALQVDPGNVTLARELGFLLLAMGQNAQAIQEFENVLRNAPADETVRRQLDQLHGRPPANPVDQAKRLAAVSLEKNYLQDAAKYLLEVAKAEPDDARTQLQLGQTYNQLHNDREAIGWFDKARRSGDPSIAAEAEQAYRNLRPQFSRVRFTTWALPFYSSRWQDTFVYGQMKTEFRLGSTALRPYLSARFAGDAGGGVRYPGVLPAQLSENAVIASGGLSLPIGSRMFAWGEAGEAIRVSGSFPAGGRMKPDYRGGLAWGRGWGRLLGSEGGGWFTESNADAIFVSRYGNDALFVLQNRIGRTLRRQENDGFQVQLLWNFNATVDQKREYWANVVEMGPGVQFRWAAMPPGLRFGVHLLRGVYLLNRGNPLRPNFYDLRAGAWYAFSR